MQAILDFLIDALNWLVGAITWAALEVYGLILDALGTVIENIPAPEFLDNVEGWIAGIPPGVAYFAGAAQLDAAFAIFASAYTVRFLIRRIPFVG